jgi:AcrR family transcriptional regulator
MSTEPNPNLGLRDRKKLATRLALSQAAIRLAVEHGLEEVRIEDIAAAANVSPRTFSNYFASKEDAFVFLGVARAEQIGVVLRARPAGESLTTALTHAVLAQYAAADPLDSQRMTQIRLIVSAPALRGAYLKTLAASEQALAEAIAARTGTDAEHDLYPRVLAAAVFGALRAATMHWLHTSATLPLATLIRQALDLVVTEGPVPSTKEGAHP